MIFIQATSLLLIVFANKWSYCTTILQDSEDGICNKTYTLLQTVRQSYVHTWYHTYWGYCRWDRCRKKELKSKIEFRTKYELVRHTNRHCCPGYQKASSDPLVCKPRCTPSCEFSDCTAPGTCTCYHGYVPKSSHECIPVCEPECISGLCIDHNICECAQGYIKQSNSSHLCTPSCDKQCINSICTKPNFCLCLIGFKPNDTNKYECIPHCDHCINGKCTKPNFCECDKGYHKVNETCQPYCSRECIQGQCTSPESCSCNEGYVNNDSDSWNICVPYCNEPCVNADCTEPNICTCFTNYTKYDNTTCKPICEKSCIYGECSEPNTCTCLDGYKPLNDYVCEPECTEECINGYCSQPDNCTCNNGYIKSEYDNYVCEPYCKDGCSNGNCTKPNICTCNNDHIKVRHNVCMPICNDDCVNNFNLCKYNAECVQIGKHLFTNKLHFTTNNVVINLNDARLTLNWSCSEIFNNTNQNLDCSFDNCEQCSSLPLTCISEINLKNKHIDFICTKYKNLEFNNTEYLNDTENFINYTGTQYDYSITIIHTEELQGLNRGRCDLCMCGTNLKNIHMQNEAQFYFAPCQSQEKEFLPINVNKDYIYISIPLLIIIGAVLLAIIVYKIRTRSTGTYGIRKEQVDNQELRVEEELLVHSGNILEED